MGEPEYIWLMSLHCFQVFVEFERWLRWSMRCANTDEADFDNRFSYRAVLWKHNRGRRPLHSNSLKLSRCLLVMLLPTDLMVRYGPMMHRVPPAAAAIHFHVSLILVIGKKVDIHWYYRPIITCWVSSILATSAVLHLNRFTDYVWPC